MERNQTEKDLSNLDVISYKDTAVVLNARADDLQKRLSQIQQKYGIKKEVVVSKSVTPTPQAAPAAGMLLQFYDRYKAMEENKAAFEELRIQMKLTSEWIAHKGLLLIILINCSVCYFAILSFA